MIKERKEKGHLWFLISSNLTMEALGAPRQNSSPNPRLESIEVHADLRHRTYARFRIGTVTHNPDVVCTTSTRAEMQPVHVQLGNLGNAGSEVIIYASDASSGYSKLNA
jgi:hypothetical protein